MKVTVDWKKNVQFLGSNSQGKQVLMEGPPEYGGQEQGIRPMEMILLGVGGCASFDVIHFLTKARQSVSDCRVSIDSKRADAVPAVFTELHLHFQISGSSITESQAARAVKLSVEKYCSAALMLQQGGVKVSHSFELFAKS